MRYTREEALNRIRKFLAASRKGDETTCQTAGRLGIFCRGYDKWSTQSLRDLYPWLAKKLPARASREELLKLIVAWDGARMLALNVETTCDAHSFDQDGCLGFDRFTDENLKRMFPKLFKPDDEIGSEELPRPAEGR
jgi:hypothetical protein